MCPTCFASNKQWFSHRLPDTDVVMHIVKAGTLEAEAGRSLSSRTVRTTQRNPVWNTKQTNQPTNQPTYLS